jgi:uncharacterized protein (DUF2384 family)
MRKHFGRCRLVKTKAEHDAEGATRSRVKAHSAPAFRATKMAAVRGHVLETFGSAEKADHWLNRANHVFGGKTPLQMMESDPQTVEIELTRIDHGVYI